MAGTLWTCLAGASAVGRTDATLWRLVDRGGKSFADTESFSPGWVDVGVTGRCGSPWTVEGEDVVGEGMDNEYRRSGSAASVEGRCVAVEAAKKELDRGVGREVESAGKGDETGREGVGVPRP